MIGAVGPLRGPDPAGLGGLAGSGLSRTGSAGPSGPAGVGDPQASLGRPGVAGNAGSEVAGSFLDALGEALAGLNDQLVAADAAAADFAAGGETDLHDVILALSEAQLGLRFGVAVRDRLLEAYQDVMRLQI
ncbi:MAG TPA: flagellar hook-basal body complex protein FliE [Candidatus Binatia bacterium]|nr:flagellar hook-basal body complex protein FliE [Candidatus Binatia bacterium]